jgi:hypothetical protein
LFSTAEEQHAADQLMANSARDEIAGCASVVTASLAGKVTNYKTSKDRAQENHTGCREAQRTVTEDQRDFCQAYDSYRMSAESAPACMSSHLGTDYVSTQEGSKLETMEECMNLTKIWLGPLYDKYVACESKGATVAEKKNDCDVYQATFELAFCEYSDTLDDTCDEYERCHNTSISHRETVYSALQVDEAVRVAEYLAAKRMQCLLQIFNASTEEPDKANKLQTCQNETYDTSHLKIVYPLIPSPTTCTREGNVPCDAEFLNVMYEAQGWHALAPTAQCMPCTVPVTPAPTTAPPPVPTTSLAFFGNVRQCACALSTAGELVCTGGDGDECQPERTLTGPFQTLTGKRHTPCAIRASDHKAECANLQGFIGTYEPAGNMPDIEWRYVAASSFFSCGIRLSDGAAVCFSAASTAIEYNMVDSDYTPTVHTGPWTKLAVGGLDVCAVLESDGTVSCWGQSETDDKYGIQSGKPTDGNIQDIKGTYYAFTVLREDGTLHSWGYHIYLSYLAYSEVEGPFSSFHVDHSAFTICALRSADSKPVCWGRFPPANTPDVAMARVYSGYKWACGVRISDERIECWGQDYEGFLAGLPGVSSD